MLVRWIELVGVGGGKGGVQYNDARIEPNISFLQIARLEDHLAEEGEYAEKGNWLDQPSVAEKKDLEFG